MNENYNNFIACSLSVMVNGKYRYFFGIVQDVSSAMSDIKYQMAVREVNSFEFGKELSLSTLRKYKALILPSQKACREFVKGVCKCFKNKDAMQTWIDKMVAKDFNACNLSDKYNIVNKHFNLIIGNVRKNKA